MSTFKCKMCGGTLEIQSGLTVAECEYCGAKQTLPKLDDAKRANLYDRANHFRRSNEFDKASAIYEQILAEDNTDAEAYWSLVLCRYGIEYVEDPLSHRRVPTVHRAQFTSIFDDDNYKSALKNSDTYQRVIYEEEAKAINEIQKRILAISQKEEPFDVFICYKETDDSGKRTHDSVLAQELYYQLKQEGFKVFFSRITLEDKLGSAYEPYIFAALNSAKVMVVLGTKSEFFNAVWVKNEWSRVLSLIKHGEKKMLIPAYKDMDPYDLPMEFSHLQAQDMSKLGFMQDLIRGIKKIVKADEPKTTVVKETVVANASANTAPLIKRVFMFLEDSKWSEANEYCEKVLDVDPECADAYLGKLLAELKVQRKTSLEFYSRPFDHTDNYNKIVRFGSDALVSELKQYNVTIRERNEENIYNTGADLANHQTPEKQIEAAEEFEKVPGYRDADTRAKNCRHQALLLSYDIAMKAMGKSTTSQQYAEAGKLFLEIADDYAPAKEKAEECAVKSKELAEVKRKDAIYAEALAAMKKDDIPSIESAIKQFQSIIAWRDSENKIEECNKKIANIKEEQKQKIIADEKAAKKRKKIIVIASSCALLFIAFVIVLDAVIIPNNKYNDAIALMDAGKYTEAISAFEALDGYKDSANKIAECNAAIPDGKYNDAIMLMNAGRLDEAYNIFLELGAYKDAVDKAGDIQLTKTKEQLKNIKVGSYINFGAYEQDNNTSNGKEDIEWLVLEVKDGKALVISKYALDCKPYNTNCTNVTWETCTLRKWLNNEFLDSAFSANEKAMIPTVTVSADKNPDYSTNPGNATQDQVFLLSITEANKYFSSNSARQCKATAYAVSGGAYAGSFNGICWWWLRSPGDCQDDAATVGCSGGVGEDGFDVDGRYGADRPALWIDLNS